MRKTKFNASLSVLLMAIGIFLTSNLDAFQSMPHEQLPKSWKADAELTDVFFLNRELGWAVGAQGVILRTEDGGRNWREISQASGWVDDKSTLQQKLKNMRTGTRTRHSGIATDSNASQLPVRLRFETVHFADPKHGWVAGGYDIPYLDRSRAIVMRTSDGGLNWEPVRSLVIPRINKIHFSDSRNGWAVGEAGNLFAPGIFYTSNGGSTWSSQSSAKMSGWLDAAKTSKGFITLDYQGRIGVFNTPEYDQSVLIGTKSVPMKQIKMIDKQNGLAVGERGTVLKTDNGGLSWTKIEFSNEKMLDQMVRHFDLHTLAITPSKIWCAGNPGTYAFSIDRKTGEAAHSRMPSTNRINKLVFADDQNGWAVGTLGSILATTDGGQNWKIQRGTNRRVAMLAISPDKMAIPHALFSKYAGEESMLCASMLLSSRREEFQAAMQATERLGCVTSSLVNPTDSREIQLEKVVRTIRALQPNVIVCNANEISVSGSNREFESAKLVQDAVRMAADRSQFPEQITLAGLKIWQTNRLAVLDATGTISIDPNQLLARTGKLMEDQIALSRAIMGQSILPGPSAVFKLTELTRNNRPKAGNLLAGLPGATIPKRSNANEKHGNLVEIQQASAKQKKFDQLVKFEAQTLRDFVVWRQQIQSLSLRMDPDVAGVWLMQLAERYLIAGKMELAAGSAEMLIERFSDHAFAPTALAWLATYYGSDECGQLEFNKRVELGLIGTNGAILDNRSDNAFNTAPKFVPSGNVSQLVWIPTNVVEPSKDAATGRVKKASANSLEPTTLGQTREKFLAARHLKAGRFLKQLGRHDPELVANEQFRFMDAQLAKQITGVIANEGRWQNIARQSPNGLGLGAHRELVINGFAGVLNSDTSVLACSKTESRPQLDGKLDDACWSNSARSGSRINPKVTLDRSDATRADDTVLFAFDNAFLYVGINCQKLPGHYYNARKTARPRDADLRRRDRVELTIDVDRDYRSAFKLAVDHRGWVNESCVGGIGWNPDWYVSQSEDQTSWTVELAIPLKQLSGQVPDASTVWAYGLKRRIFNDRNVWLDESIAAGAVAGEFESGLRVGLSAKPQEFELMRFGQLNSEVSIENSSTRRMEHPSTISPTEAPNSTLNSANLSGSGGQFVPLEVTNQR